MQPQDWYYNQLELDCHMDNALPMEQHRLSALILSNHYLYGNLCNWYDVSDVYAAQLYWRKSGNYIHQLNHLYNLYKLAIKGGDVKTLYRLINILYKSLIKLKNKKITINLLLNSFPLNDDVISVIEHYYTFLFLWQ